jgi:serine/threonine-protein kinase RsbW
VPLVATTNQSTETAVARVRLTFPAKAEYITLGRLALTGLARLRPLSDETLGDLKLALTEACTNCVLHAYPDRPGKVEITYELQADRLAIEIADDGPGFDYTNGDGVEADLMEGGLGLAIIRALADEFELGEREGRPGSRLRFVKLLPSS